MFCGSRRRRNRYYQSHQPQRSHGDENGDASNRVYRRRRNRLYRSHKDVVFFGVCGGIAEHFDIAPWGVRVGVILLTMLGGFPWIPIAYVIMGMTMKQAPEERFENYEQEEFWNVYQSSRAEALRKVHRAYQMLDKRLQRMESIVTAPSFELEEEWRRL